MTAWVVILASSHVRFAILGMLLNLYEPQLFLQNRDDSHVNMKDCWKDWMRRGTEQPWWGTRPTAGTLYLSAFVIVTVILMPSVGPGGGQMGVSSRAVAATLWNGGTEDCKLSSFIWNLEFLHHFSVCIWLGWPYPTIRLWGRPIFRWVPIVENHMDGQIHRKESSQ